jgi:hypothetical protein
MIITQFTTDPTLMNLMNKHMGWHGDSSANAMGFPRRSIPEGQPGSGNEFLTFHASILNDFTAWNNSHGQPISPLLIAPWLTLPPEIKSQENATWQAADLRVTSNSPTFGTADAMGIFIEGGIHDQFLHSAAAAAYGESILTTFSSLESTYFYQLHGWINHWWQHWFPSKSVIKDVLDQRVHKVHKEVKEFIKEHIKELIKDHKEVLLEGQKLQLEVPKLKDAEGNPGVQFGGDPEMMRAMSQRLTALEKTVNQAAPFIKQAERPNVGAHTAKQATKGNKNK